ncbi:hypothetical protein AB0M43_38585 [Longispora sp. NPDC051575]|uniref:Arm DNA-binding domain-containing protein n=1 Tax=Longispora sp. NPDC051575 TaxID=3154943 RepID=UPI003423B7D6
MAVYEYQLASGKTRWFYKFDLPAGPDNKRRTKKERGYLTDKAAAEAERKAREVYGQTDLAADGSVKQERDCPRFG